MINPFAIRHLCHRDARRRSLPWSRRALLVPPCICYAVGAIAIALDPAHAVLWACVLGCGNGAIFPLMMTLPLDAADRPEQVAGMVGMMLGIGYAYGALAPAGARCAARCTGSFAVGLWVIAGAAVLGPDLRRVLLARPAPPRRASGLGHTRTRASLTATHAWGRSSVGSRPRFVRVTQIWRTASRESPWRCGSFDEWASAVEAGLPWRDPSRVRSRKRWIGRLPSTTLITSTRLPLETAVSRFELVCHAWCLLPNHSHLVMTSKLGNLSRAMHWLGTCSAGVPNRRHERSGHVYQGRFGSKLVERRRVLSRARALLAAQPRAGRIVSLARTHGRGRVTRRLPGSGRLHAFLIRGNASDCSARRRLTSTGSRRALIRAFSMTTGGGDLRRCRHLRLCS